LRNKEKENLNKCFQQQINKAESKFVKTETTKISRNGRLKLQLVESTGHIPGQSNFSPGKSPAC
jgi:hypothetical protein